MKGFIVLVAMLAQIFAAKALMAAPVMVDFGVLGINAVDITTAVNPAGLTLNGVTFRYDDFGSGVDFGMADQFGIFGTTAGSVIFDFSAPVNTLNFNFSLLGAPADIPDSLFLAFNGGGTPVLDMLIPAASDGFDAFGSVAYSGATFDQALMLFSLNAPFFTIENVSYDNIVNQTVPEPGTFALMAFGVFAVIAWRYFRRGFAGGGRFAGLA